MEVERNKTVKRNPPISLLSSVFPTHSVPNSPYRQFPHTPYSLFTAQKRWLVAGAWNGKGKGTNKLVVLRVNDDLCGLACHRRGVGRVDVVGSVGVEELDQTGKGSWYHVSVQKGPSLRGHNSRLERPVTLVRDPLGGSRGLELDSGC